MPRKPRRPCRAQGCLNLALDGKQYCQTHQGIEDYEYNHFRRNPDTKKMYGQIWRRIRDRYVAEHPMCEECFRKGIYKPTQEVHHKLPLADGGTHEKNNLISLCRVCHIEAHEKIGTRKRHSFDD